MDCEESETFVIAVLVFILCLGFYVFEFKKIIFLEYKPVNQNIRSKPQQFYTAK